MKKTLALLLALAMVFALCACGQSSAPAAVCSAFGFLPKIKYTAKSTSKRAPAKMPTIWTIFLVNGVNFIPSYRFSLRNCFGVISYFFLNTRMKWLQSAKPVSSEI